jgi:hypothetical protein
MIAMELNLNIAVNIAPSPCAPQGCEPRLHTYPERAGLNTEPSRQHDEGQHGQQDQRDHTRA